MKVQVQKWGNSLALRIPKSFAQEIEIEQGSVVDLSLEKGEIIIRPVEDEPEYTLDQLLARVTKDNIHQEVDTGKARGREAW
jgi:antitoxin MazE